jgi:hypothetical protein
MPDEGHAIPTRASKRFRTMTHKQMTDNPRCRYLPTFPNGELRSVTAPNIVSC